MELKDLLAIGAKTIQKSSDKSTTNIPSGTIVDALGKVIGTVNGRGGGLDLDDLIRHVLGKGNGPLAAILSSWLGGGKNRKVKPQQIASMVGSEKVNEFAQAMGISTQSAERALADALPRVIDKATPGSSGTNLIELLAPLAKNSTGIMGILGTLLGR